MNEWRKFHHFNPYQDKEDQRAAERAKDRREESAYWKSLKFALKDPEAKLRQNMRQCQTHRAKSKSRLITLPPPFPPRGVE